MRAFLKQVSLFILATALASIAAASGRWETLRAINLVENPTNHNRMGSKGELGPYQFRSQTWRMHSRRPFSEALNRTSADEVAARHYEWIRIGLVGAGIDPNPYNIALAWNCGLGAVVGGRVPASSYQYAEQVTNLVASFAAKRDEASSQQAKGLVARVAAPARVLPLVANAEAERFDVNTSPGPRFHLRIEQAGEQADPVVYTDQAPLDLTIERPVVAVRTLPTPAFALLN
jgi:hypothetical protein